MSRSLVRLSAIGFPEVLHCPILDHQFIVACAVSQTGDLWGCRPNLDIVAAQGIGVSPRRRFPEWNRVGSSVQCEYGGPIQEGVFI